MKKITYVSVLLIVMSCAFNKKNNVSKEKLNPNPDFKNLPLVSEIYTHAHIFNGSIEPDTYI